MTIEIGRDKIILSIKFICFKLYESKKPGKNQH